MDETNSFLIPTVPTDVPPEAAEEICVYRGHRWLEPDQPALVKALQDVASHPERCRRVARKAAADMRRLFSLERARDAVEQLLCHLEQRFTCAALASRPQSTPGLDAGSESPPIRLQWEGELFAGHSFSNINEKLCLVFGDHPALDLSIRRIHQHPTHDNRVAYAHRLRPFIDRPLAGGPQVTVRHAFPPNWQRPATGLWVHIQPWEYGPLPVAWVGPLRDEVDEIWAPSNYVKRVYVQSGIAEEKIHVIPWGVAPQVFQPEAPPLHLPAADAFVFLFVGGTIHRKGFDLLFDAYLTEFGKDDNVCLVIKDLGTTSFYRYGNARERILQAIADERAPRIVYTDENMTEGQLASLYTACHCLVAPYRGEGFGLPILEAMACGLPVVTSAVTSLPEICGDAALLVEPTESERIFEAVRRVLVDSELAADLRRRGSAHARKFTWKRCAKQTVLAWRNALREDGAQPRLRHSL